MLCYMRLSIGLDMLKTDHVYSVLRSNLLTAEYLTWDYKSGDRGSPIYRFNISECARPLLT